MNLHGIVAPYIGAINPFLPIVVRKSIGYATQSNGQRVPTYSEPNIVMGQIQPLAASDLLQIDSLNIQGIKRAVYINGSVDGIIRLDKKGGDLIMTVDERIWLVVHVLEYWPDWSKFVITLQNYVAKPTETGSLDFSDPDNSQYIPALG